jgi:hypothetical protein
MNEDVIKMKRIRRNINGTKVRKIKWKEKGHCIVE